MAKIDSSDEKKLCEYFYEDLLLLAINNDGKLINTYTEEPYSIQDISEITTTDIKRCELWIDILKKIGLIVATKCNALRVKNNVTISHVLYLPQLHELIGKNDDSTPRVKRHRASKLIGSKGEEGCNALHSVSCNGHVTKCNALEIDIEKEIDIKIEKEEELEKDGEVKGEVIKKPCRCVAAKKKYFDVIFLTDEEYQELLNQFGEQRLLEMMQSMSDWCLAKGKRYKNYKAAIRNWFRNQKQEKLQSQA
jgi:hypothetical protein